MPVIQVFHCPSCSAKLPYDGGPALTFACPFCGTLVVVPPEFRNPQTGPTPAERGGQTGERLLEQLGEVRRLALAGRKVDAIRLYRQLTGAALKEAKDAVERVAADQPLVVDGTVVRAPTTLTPEQAKRAAAEKREAAVARLARARRETRGMSLVIGGCSSLLILSVLGFIMVTSSGLPLRLSGSYRQALAAAQSNPAVIKALGAPVRPEGMPGNGYVSCLGSTCTAAYVIRLRGAERGGRIEVLSHSIGAGFLNEGTWILDAVVVVENDGVVIKLTEVRAPEGARTTPLALTP